MHSLSDHERRLISPQAGGGAVLGHVGLLGGGDVLLLLLDPAGGDLQHQTLQEVKGHTVFSSPGSALRSSAASHLQVMPTARRHFLSPEIRKGAWFYSFVAMETGEPTSNLTQH